MSAHFTRCGIPGVDTVPYGLHLCHFYRSRQELLDGLIPYFQAGLQNNERCLWVASPPLPAKDVNKEVANYPDLRQGVDLRQLTILDAAEWYGSLRDLKVEGTVRRCLDEEEAALANGHKGFRISGNTSFLASNDWSVLIEYEKALHAAMQGRRIIACCSYDHLKCDAAGILEVVHSHDAALDRAGKTWQVYTPKAIRGRYASRGQESYRGGG